MKNYIKEDHRNYRCNFAVAKRKPEKNSGLYGFEALTSASITAMIVFHIIRVFKLNFVGEMLQKLKNNK